jgi:hypothetical protein
MAFETGPHLNVAAFCEMLLEDKSGVLSLIRIVDRLQITSQGSAAPEEMPPTILNWYLVLVFKSGEARGSHQIKIQPEPPSGIKLDPMSVSAHFEGGNRGTNVITRVNMPLQMPGIYWFWIYVDDQFVTKIPVEVIYSRIVMPPPKPPR